MTEQIKTITDKSQFQLIIDKFYSGKEVFIKTKSGNLILQFLGYSQNQVAFRIPRVQNVPEAVIIYARAGNVTINGKMKYLERNEDTFIFEPLLFQVLTSVRKEDRKELPSGEASKNVVYIEKLLSDFIIKNELSMNEKKIDQIREIIKFELSKQFHHIFTYFIHEPKSDLRFKRFQADITPIFIPDLNKKADEKHEKDYNFYINEIYAKDYKLSSKKDLISEISIPVLIRNMFPFGYIQVNNTSSMTDGHLASMKRMALITNELFRKNGFFVPEEEKILVSDMSAHGMGIVFRDRRITRFFKANSFVSFEIKLPTGKKIVLGAVVRNVVFKDTGIIRAGFEITVIDAISEVHYDEYLDMLKVEDDKKAAEDNKKTEETKKADEDKKAVEDNKMVGDN